MAAAASGGLAGNGASNGSESEHPRAIYINGRSGSGSSTHDPAEARDRSGGATTPDEQLPPGRAPAA